MATEKEVLEALFAKIHAIITSPDSVNNEPGERPYLSFCKPGIPVSGADLDFGFSILNQQQLDAAADFSFLVNTIPNIGDFWSSTGRHVFDVYEDVLQNKELPQANITAAEEQALKKARDKLFRSQYIQVSPGVTEARTVDSLLVEDYKKLQAEYINARAEYNNAYLNSIMDPTNPIAAMKWSMNEPIYKDKLRTAWDRFSVVKNTVEIARGVIASIEQKGLQAQWNHLQSDFKDAERAGNFYFTKYFPNRFWEKEWTKYSFAAREVSTIDTSASKSWGGSSGFSVGLFSFGASASYSSASSSHACDTEGLEAHFELATIPLRRTWLDASILVSKGWRFQNVFPDVLSDGGDPPKGLMVCFPTAMLVARNLKINLNKSSTTNSSASSSFSSQGKVGWGPFSLRGNYSRQNSSTTHDFTETQGGIEAPGMQIIGFVNQILPKSPDPAPGLFP